MSVGLKTPVFWLKIWLFRTSPAVPHGTSLGVIVFIPRLPLGPFCVLKLNFL